MQILNFCCSWNMWLGHEGQSFLIRTNVQIILFYLYFKDKLVMIERCSYHLSQKLHILVAHWRVVSHPPKLFRRFSCNILIRQGKEHKCALLLGNFVLVQWTENTIPLDWEYHSLPGWGFGGWRWLWLKLFSSNSASKREKKIMYSDFSDMVTAHCYE